MYQKKLVQSKAHYDDDDDDLGFRAPQQRSYMAPIAKHIRNTPQAVAKYLLKSRTQHFSTDLMLQNVVMQRFSLVLKLQ